MSQEVLAIPQGSVAGGGKRKGEGGHQDVLHLQATRTLGDAARDARAIPCPGHYS